MQETIFPIPADQLIPHRPPMKFIDALESYEDGIGIVSARMTAEHPLMEENGALADVVLLELLAQSYAAVQGYADSLSGAPVRQGFLVGVRKIALRGQPQEGDLLQVRVRATAQLEGFALVEGEVRRQEEILACGNIKLWIVPEEGNSR